MSDSIARKIFQRTLVIFATSTGATAVATVDAFLISFSSDSLSGSPAGKSLASRGRRCFPSAGPADLPEEAPPALPPPGIALREPQRAPDRRRDRVVDRNPGLLLEPLDQRPSPEVGAEDGDGLRLRPRHLAHHRGQGLGRHLREGEVALVVEV